MIFTRKKKDKIQKTRFEDQEDQKDGWSQSVSNSDAWGAADQSGWGQNDQSGWEQPDQSSHWEQPNQSGHWEQPNQSGHWEQPNQSGHWEQPNKSGRGQTDPSGWDKETGGGWGSAETRGWNTEVPIKQKTHPGRVPAKSSHWTSWGHDPTAQLNINSSNVKTLQRPTLSIPGKSNLTTLSTQDQSAILNSLLSQPAANARRDSFSHTPFTQQQLNNLQQGVPTLKRQQTVKQRKMQSPTPQNQWGPTWDDIPEEEDLNNLRQGVPTFKPQQPPKQRKMQSATPQNQWGSTWDDIPEEDEDELEYIDEDDDDWGYSDNNHRDYFAPAASSYFSSPSRTLSNALGPLGHVKPFASPSVDRNPRNHRFIESHGAALSNAHQALYGHERLAKERFYWSFSPDKDERVRSLMQWIQMMSEGLGAFGLQKFLQTGDRGALFANADFRPHESPQDPAFDWVTIERLKDTMDKILQESVALYDPAVQVIVFVFLLSKSGNSMAIWRRKIPVTESLRTTYQVAIQDTIANLKPDYPVYVDELPSKATDSTKRRRLLSKRKWWKPWSASKPPVPER